MTYSIIEHCNSTNNFLSVVDGSIKVENAATLSPDILKLVKDNKPDIIEALKRDKKAKKNGLLIGIPGTLYTWSLSRRSTVYLELINNEWLAWRETYESSKSKAINTKTIARGKTFSYVLNELKRYMDYVRK